MFHMFPNITSLRNEYTADEIKSAFKRFLSEATVVARAIKMADNKYWIRPARYTNCSVDSLEQIHGELMKEVNDLAAKLSPDDIEEMVAVAKKGADATRPLNYKFSAPHFGMWDAIVKDFIKAVERRTNGTLNHDRFILMLYSECALTFLRKRNEQFIKYDVLHRGIIGRDQLLVIDSSSFSHWIPMLQNAFAKDNEEFQDIFYDEVMHLVRRAVSHTNFHDALQYSYCLFTQFNEKNPNATREECLEYFMQTFVEYKKNDSDYKNNLELDEKMAEALKTKEEYDKRANELEKEHAKILQERR